MTRKDPVLFLEDILEAMKKIERYTKDKDIEEFRSDPMMVDAILRNLEVIGEASTNLSSEFREKNPDIPWKRMIGLRNIVIHEYFGVDLNIIWRIVTKDLPETKPLIENLLEDLD